MSNHRETIKVVQAELKGCPEETEENKKIIYKVFATHFTLAL